MKVRDLLAALATVNPGAEVLIAQPGGISGKAHVLGSIAYSARQRTEEQQMVTPQGDPIGPDTDYRILLEPSSTKPMFGTAEGNPPSWNNDPEWPEPIMATHHLLDEVD